MHASMNQSYRLVFNETTQTWCAVSEISKSRGKRGRSAKVLAAIAALIGLGIPAYSSGQSTGAAPANPLPTGDGAATVGGATARIQQLDIAGLDDASLKSSLESMVVSDWRDKDVNLSGLRQIATQVQSLLRTSGYPFASVSC